MKRTILMIVFLIAASSAFAQEYGRFGVGVSGSFYRWREYNVSSAEEADLSFSISVAFSAMLGEKLELKPQVTYGNMVMKEDDIQDNGEFTVGGGIGLYWHLVRTEYFRIGPGISVSGNFTKDSYPDTDSASTFIPALKIPLMVEFVFLKNFTFRMEYNMLGFGWILREANSGDKDNYTVIQAFPTGAGSFSENSYIMSLVFPALTFGFTFRF